MVKYLKTLPYKLFIIVLLAVMGGSALPAGAAGSDISGAVTQSYSAGPSVLSGMLVEPSAKDSSTVIPLTNGDIQKMLGVVVPANDAAVTLTPQTVSGQQVLVAVSGRYNMLVSNQGGSIKSGDYLTISSLDGIGMKADASQSEVVGRAAGGFSGHNNVLSSVALKGGTTANIGFVTVDVHLSANPLFHQDNGTLPGFLAKTASGVANKPVSPPRIYLGAILLMATLLITGSMFYGGVRSSIVAIGRNPLSKRSIGRGMAQTMVAALIVFSLGILAVYLILKL